MMTNKEKNFISAVVRLHNDSEHAVEFFEALYQMFERHFEQYEFVVIDDACTDNTIQLLRDWAMKIDKPLTVIHMSINQTLENCMNAGLDAAIGDFIYEFDSTEMPYNMELIFTAYQTAMMGNDIVTVCPSKLAGSSKLFYKIYNANSNSPYSLKTDAFCLVSRRAINRVHASSVHLPYRKAAYATSGLKMTNIDFKGRLKDKTTGRASLAIDSLVLYTNAGFKISVLIAIALMFFTLCEMIYVLVIFFNGRPMEGWTTTMFVMTFGFSGLFAVLAIVIKYLSILVDLVFRKQKYLVESIEKIQK